MVDGKNEPWSGDFLRGSASFFLQKAHVNDLGIAFSCFTFFLLDRSLWPRR